IVYRNRGNLVNPFMSFYNKMIKCQCHKLELLKTCHLCSLGLYKPPTLAAYLSSIYITSSQFGDEFVTHV
ncbi:hypothetical protein L9F63_000106, partial [Diploptera punctata]